MTSIVPPSRDASLIPRTDPRQPAGFAPRADPRRLGPYEVLEVAGRGGMGVVYKGRHEKTGEAVALKTVASVHESELAGIRCEIHALQQLRHPGVVRIVGSGVDEGLPWYAMELLEGRTLQHLFADVWQTDVDAPTTPRHEFRTLRIEPVSGTALTVTSEARLREVLTVMRRLCVPLAYIHGHGLVHRDLKPANVFLRGDGQPVLVDFGVSSRFSGAGGREVLEVGAAIAGTVFYMSPEQADGLPVDARADLYALGIMLYQLVTGRPPFRGRTALELIEQHRNAVPAPPSQIAAGVPKALDELILGLLAKRPRDRIGHADDVAEALAALGADAPERSAETRAYLYRPELEGRDASRATIRERIAAAQAGRGALLFVRGESGVGKTALAVAVGREARRLGWRVVTGECLPLGSADATGESKGGPLHPLRTLLQAVADAALAQGPEAFERLLGPRAKVLEPYEPSLGGLPGQAALPAAAAVSAEAARRRLLDDLAETLAAFAAETPLLLILDDLQWADELTLAFLESLQPGYFEARRLLILGTYRSDEAGPPLRALAERKSALDLARLDERAVAEMVAGMLGLHEPPAGFVSFLARQSEGNPFFVAEYLRAAVSDRLLFRRDGRWRVADGEAAQPFYEVLPLPGSLRELIAHRLDGLSGPAQRLAEGAAVLGRELDGALLSAVSGLGEEATIGAATELIGRGVLEAGGAGQLRFAHDKLREVAYERQQPARRSELHGRAAAAIEQRYGGASGFALRYQELAHHWDRAGVVAKAASYAERAGEHALRRGAYREALELLSRLLALDGASAAAGAPLLDTLRRARAERGIGDAHYGLGHFAEARAHVERSLRRLGRSAPGGGAALGLGLATEALRQFGHRVFGYRITQNDAARAEAVRGYYTLVHVFFHTNQMGHYTYANLRLLNLAERAAPGVELAEAYALIALIAGLLPQRRLAAFYSERAFEAARAVESPAALASVQMITSIYGVGTGDWPRMRVATQQAAELAGRIGDGRRFEESTSLAALVAYHSGELARSRELWASVARRARNPQPLVWMHCGRAEVALREGSQALAREALRQLDTAERLVKAERLAPADEIRVYGDLALARLRNGEAEAALECAARARRSIVKEAHPTAFWTVEGAVGAAEVYLELLERPSAPPRRDDVVSGARQICKALRAYAGVFPIAEPRAYLCLGRLQAVSGEREQALRSWRRALASAERLEMPYEQARALQLLAACEADPAARRARLERARQILERIGISPKSPLLAASEDPRTGDRGI
jgi:serine/threonine protein kinase